METPSPDTPDWPSDWLRGVLGVCVLHTLTAGPNYGYAIAQALADSGLGTVKGGTLYPLLTRLEAAGLVEVEWRAGDAGPGRKFYTLTDAGHAEARNRTAAWNAFVDVTRRHLAPAASAAPTPSATPGALA